MTNVLDRNWPLPEAIPAPSWQDVLPRPQTGRWRRTSEREHTFVALAAARKNALYISGYRLAQDRYIILSDVHKGDRRKGLDDFAHNESLYCHALNYYLNQDYRLVLNGDIEEGWKARLPDIVEAYESSAFAAEGEFARSGCYRYLRIYGNHDMDWADPGMVERYLQPALGRSVRVFPGVMLGDRIMITHGHQGEANSDRRAWLSRRIVRHLWRPIQPHLPLTLNRAASPQPIHRHREQHLHAWARANRTLLIAGHTHRALLDSMQFDDPAVHYLNDGCCIHTDGITGIEIDRGEIRLVKWELPGDTPQRSIFRSNDLGALLAQL